jgi:hypothetical protein
MSDSGSRGRGRTERLPPEDGLDPRAGAQPGTRRTERLSPTGDDWSQREPVNPGWRNERATGRKAAKGGVFPRSPQEFQLWLQGGGWRYVAGIAALLVLLLIAVLAFSRNEQRQAGLPQVGEEQPAVSEPVLGVGSAPEDGQPTVTLPPPTAVQPSFFVVTGTSGQGLFLRPQPSVEGDPLTTLPDGTRLEQIGEDVTGPDRVWRQVRAPDGQEGYVAVDFLTPAP